MPLLLAMALLLPSLPLVSAHEEQPVPNASDIVRGAPALLCAGAPVADSLQSVGLRSFAESNHGGQEQAVSPLALLKEHGFRTALDLRLLDA
eukprot:SAG31_NODE_23941_length_492_cov_1.216285_1_plen_91_part_10